MKRRHMVIASCWDGTKQRGTYTFRCMHCGYEYRWPCRNGPRGKWFTKIQFEFFAGYWARSGCTVDHCRGCTPDRAKT